MIESDCHGGFVLVGKVAMNSWGFVGWQAVERADGAGGADRADMSIDHGGTDVGVAERA